MLRGLWTRGFQSLLILLHVLIGGNGARANSRVRMAIPKKFAKPGYSGLKLTKQINDTGSSLDFLAQNSVHVE